MRWRPVALALLAVGLVATAGCAGLGGPSGETTPTPPYIAHDGENVTVQPAAEQTISGATTLEAGENVTVRVQSSGGESPFLKTDTANVTEGGSFEATFDFSGVESGAPFEVTVRHNGSEIVAADGVVA
ncbi:PGF-CTERM sorting domain-containing protein [Halarchaeum sp. CBA1220]|uniref:BGTF surface domain-containing protein n=1 Tax=Halarchaeum sp. CBA1220 TaxID=1853682 RepID=UPI000F3AA398|nr:BGTF surface domain-containing protein [Halarchaeum sp. CBA1220]QLC33908.1 PGF-CTERM sorting domain-containing protein [Halarchaeum sp. CBA1220]